MNKKAMLFIVLAMSLFLIGAVSADETLESNVENDTVMEDTSSYSTADSQNVQTIEKESSSESTDTKIKTSTNTTKSDIDIKYKKVKAYSGQNITVNATVTADDDSDVSISTSVLKINGKTITKSSIKNGTVSFNFVVPTLKEGTHTITIQTGDTSSYNAAVSNNTLTIYRRNVTISMSNVTSYANKSINVIAKVTSNNTKVNISTAILKIAGITMAKTSVVNGVANFSLTTPCIKAGTYDMYVVTATTTLFNSANITKSMKINRLNLSISGSNVTSYTGKTVKYTAKFSAKNMKNITNIPAVLKINGVTISNTTVNNSKAVFNFTTPELKEGTYNLTVKVGTSKYYNATNMTRTLTIIKQNVTITANNLTGYSGKSVSLTATFKSSSGTKINLTNTVLKINGQSVAYSSVVNGTAKYTFKIPSLSPGTYKIIIKTGNTTSYNPANITRVLTVVKQNLTIVSNNLTGYSGKNLGLGAKFVSTNGTYVNISNSVLKIDGKSVAYSSIVNGTARYNFTVPSLSPGNYTMLIKTGDTTNYNAANITKVLTVTKQNVTISFSSISGCVGSNLTLTATFKSTNGSAVNIDNSVLKINTQTLASSSVVNGTAKYTFTVPNVSAGNYSLIIKTGSTNTYNAANATKTITVIKYNASAYTKLAINMSKWNYDSTNNIYYQIGLTYCTDPETTTYESLGIYVPGKYFNAKKNSDGTYTCTVNTTNKVGNYTASSAPIVIPVNTPGYSAQAAPTSYSSSEVATYLSYGFVYVNAGCRGRSNGDSYDGGAPWGVTDLKAAIRYIKYNNASLPGNPERIFTFGHSGGGAQSAIVGASGDSELYTPYLESIGAIMVDKNGNYLSDSVCGSMCWCPITSLDYADEAYEWNMGQYSTSGTRSSSSWTSSLSDDLATAYATYINSLKLKDSTGTVLTLNKTSSGIYTSGTYYDYIISVIEESLNNFLSDTSFPYTPSSSSSGGPPGFGSSSSSSTTYSSAQDYIDSLNEDEEWVTYNSKTNTVTVTSIEGFVNACKSATKDVGAFDDLDRGQAENDLFGTGETDYLHFDSVMAGLLKNNSAKYSKYSDYDSSYASEYASDLTELDALNYTIQERVNMYNPMYYLCDYYEGSGTSTVAKYWRINSGIEQGDTALTVEANLALALNQSSDVESVEFSAVWAQGHTQAERTGSSSTNFINWINECLN